jgi:hypothetical protein
MATVDIVTKLWTNLYVGLDKVVRSFQENEVPTLPVMVATATGQTTISLSIITPSAVVGHAPVHGYKFYTDALVPVSSNTIDVAGVGSTYTVTGLTASTAYSYVAKGLSVDNVLSGSSAVVSVTTQSVSQPVHTLVPGIIPNQSINPGQSFTPFNLNLFFTDSWSHTLTFTMSGTQPATMATNLTTGDVTFTGPESTLAVYTITATADDGYTATVPLPLQVTGLSAPVNQAAYVTLTWNNLDNESGYYVERSLNNSTWTTIGSTTTDVVSYTDSTVSATTLYYYRVRAFSATGNGTYSSTISLTTPTSSIGPAEADWLSRSTGAGVVWAHDFRDAAEFSNFHELGYGFTKVAGQWTNNNDTNIPGGLESAGVVAGVTGITTLSRDTTLKIPNTMGASVKCTIPYGFTGYPGASADGGGSQGGDVPVYFSNGTSEIWSAGRNVMEGRVAWGKWARPFSALLAGGNGKAADDPAAQNSVTKRTWNQLSRYQFGSFKKGYYGHTDYWGTGGSSLSDWDGTEFYLQLRVMFSTGRHGYMDGSRVPSIAGQSPYPGRAYAAGGKLLWIVDNAGNDAEMITVSGGNQGQRYDTLQGAGAAFTMYTNRPAETITYPFTTAGYANGRTQPGGPYDACDISNNLAACWRWPENEWVTLMFWVKPGHQGGAWQPDSMKYPQDTYFRVYIASQTAGQAPQYVDLFKMPDGTGRWWQWQDPAYGTPQGQFQFLLLNGYMNNVPSVVGFTQSFTQIIFSKSFIPCPQY